MSVNKSLNNMNCMFIIVAYQCAFQMSYCVKILQLIVHNRPSMSSPAMSSPSMSGPPLSSPSVSSPLMSSPAMSTPANSSVNVQSCNFSQPATFTCMWKTVCCTYYRDNIRWKFKMSHAANKALTICFKTTGAYRVKHWRCTVWRSEQRL